MANPGKVQALLDMADNDGLYYEVPMRCGADAKALKVALGEIRVRMDKPPPRGFQLVTPMVSTSPLDTTSALCVSSPLNMELGPCLKGRRDARKSLSAQYVS